MLQPVIVKTTKEAGVSIEAIHRLVEDSYRQLSANGIDTPLLHMSNEEFQRALSRAAVFVALDADTGELLGTHSFTSNRQRGYMFGFCLAIAPKAKRLGIATQMLEAEAERILKAGYRYLKGSTPVASTWSVRWHLKNGYRIIGYKRSPENNGGVYVFRKQLVPSLLWDSSLFCHCCYLASYAITKLTKDSNGRPNLVGRVLKKMIGKSKKEGMPAHPLKSV